MELKRVVVTGIGAITPLGNTFPETWENLKKGVSGCAPITKFDASKFKTQFACEVKNFDPADHFDRKEARKIDPYRTRKNLRSFSEKLPRSWFNWSSRKSWDQRQTRYIYAMGEI